jgi:hypothetical protein
MYVVVITCRRVSDCHCRCVLALAFNILGCPFADETLGSKKLFPGWNFKSAKTAKTSAWASRSKVTQESAKIAFEFLHWSHVKLPVQLRRKKDKNSCEEVSEMAALAVSLVQEIAREVPIPYEVLDTELGPWLFQKAVQA